MASFFRRSSLRLCAASACVAALLLSPLAAVAQVTVSGDQCAYKPYGTVSVADVSHADGAVVACQPNAQGSVSVTFYAPVTHSTDDGKMFKASASYSVCPPGGGACQSGDISSNTQYSSVSFTPAASGAYTLQVTTTTSPQSGDFTINPFTCRYSNSKCVTACRSCSTTVAVKCYYQDPAGLAAAQAASPSGGAGADSVILGTALTSGTPFAATSFGASLPLASGQTLNPRCALSKLTFNPYTGASLNYAVPLPADGSDEVVITDCSAISAAQVALITGANPSGASTFLNLASSSLCKDVLRNSAASAQYAYDTAVTQYTFAGDINAKTPSNAVNSFCGDLGMAQGPSVALPAASWRSSSFSVTTRHTTAASLCADESCIGGGADGRCNACSYTYKVRFACDAAPSTPTPPPASGGGSGGGSGGIIGDPQFVGLRGQSYQVHGVSGSVYSIVSAPALQYNARFVFLSSGACPVIGGVRQRRGCYSHPGSYLGELGLKTAGEAELIRIAAGGAAAGFAAVTLNERELALGETVQLSGGGSLTRNSTHVVSVSVGPWAFEFANSDRFVNQRVAVSGDMSQLHAHGLLGQTWRERSFPHSPLKFVEGAVDDYLIREGDVFGDSFAFNAFN